MKANRAAATRRDAGDAAVSDVIGSILLVAITVLTVGAFALLLFAFDGPRDVPQTNLAVTVQPGNGNWGNGDERIVIHHLGGDALTEGGIRIAYSVNSGAVTSVSGSALGFLQGQFKIGDTWTSPVLTLQSTDVVHVNVVAQAKNSGEALLASLNIIPAQVSAGSTCPFDSTAPSGSWLQSPSDVTILTSSAITVTLTVTDDCAGPDPAAIPHVFWGISPAATIDRGAMTSLGSNQWQASIPVPVGGWSSQGLRTLQYYASPLTDIRGNGGASATVNDLVDLSGATPVYVSSQSVVAPTPPLANPTNLGADDGALAVLSEGATTATAVLATNNQVSASGWSSTGSNPEDATTSNNGYRTNSASPPNPLRLGFPNPSPGGTITQVNVKVEQSITSFVDNAWAVRACVAGGGCGTTSATQLGTSSGSTDVTRTFDVTTLHPTGASSWTWTDVNNLEVEVLVGFGANGNRDGSTARVDYVTVEVVHATYTGTLQLDWTGVPVSSTYFLDLEYTASADETFNVNVWDWTTSSYATRGTLTATSPTPFAYLLTANEVQGGAVRVRLVDVNAADTVLSTVSLDYARLDLV